MRSPQYSVPTTLALVISSLLAPNAFAEESEQDTETMIVRSTAEEALKQQPGGSILLHGHKAGLCLRDASKGEFNEEGIVMMEVYMFVFF